MNVLAALAAWLPVFQRAAKHERGNETGIIDAGPAVPDDRPVIGVWLGRSATEADIRRLYGLGVRRFDIIVNDHSTARRSRKFDTYPQWHIARLAKAATQRGCEVNLMSWLMPHAPYLRQAAAELAELAELTGARGVVFDLEEPWTQAKGGMGYTAAAKLFADEWLPKARALKLLSGVTGIRHASKRKLGPFIKLIADYLVPQCYATRTSKASPLTVVAKGVRQWLSRFGTTLEIVPALAAYRQRGIAHHTPRSAMLCALETVDPYPACLLWYEPTILADARVAQAIRDFTR